MKVALATNTDNNYLVRNQNSYLGIVGAGYIPAPVGELHASYSQNSTLMGGEGGTLSNFRIEISVAPGTDNGWTFTLRKNGVATAVVITISGSSTTGTDTSRTVHFDAGDWLQWMIVPAGTPNYATLLTGCRADITNPFFTVPIPLPSAGIWYTQAHAQVAIPSSTEDFIQKQYLPCAGTIKNMRVLVSDAPGAGESYAITLMKNGVAQSLTAAVEGTGTTATDLINTVAVVADDYISYKIVASSGANSTSSVKVVADFVPSAGKYPYMSSSSDEVDNYHTMYLFLNCSGGSDPSGIVELQGQYIFSNYATLDKLHIRLAGAPGAGKSWTLVLRKNGADTDLAIVIADTDTTGSDLTHSVDIADGDKVTLRSVPSGDPIQQGYHFSFAYTPGKRQPSGNGDYDEDVRVSSIRHIFQPGSNRMQVGLGDLGFDVDVAEAAIRKITSAAIETGKLPEEPRPAPVTIDCPPGYHMSYDAWDVDRQYPFCVEDL